MGQNKKNKKKQATHKLISVLVAIVLIIVIVIIAFGKQIKNSMASGEAFSARWLLSLIYPDKYAYSTEYADLNEYFQLFSQDDVAIINGQQRIDARGKVINGEVYFDLATVGKLFTDRFYYNENEKVLLYTTQTDIYRVNLEDASAGYTYAGEFNSLTYMPAALVGDTVYVALDYAKLFSNFDYSYYEEPYRVVIHTSWDSYRAATINKETYVRYQGGIKSNILTKVEEGASVEILEVMDTWTKVLTVDGYAGYVENDTLSEEFTGTRTPVTGAYDPYSDYEMGSSDNESVIMAWHQIYYADDGSGMNNLLSPESGVNVVSPTWFYINSEDGTFDNYATSDYVQNAHEQGYQVWALVEDMTNEFDEYALFADSANRKAFIDNLINSVVSVGADGINVDCERIGSETGPHFVQFLRELSIETHKNNLVLSVDNYVQNAGNLYYDLGEQGLIADYVIIMGYDEHWAGSDAGSVASIDFVEGGITSALDAGVPAEKLINAVPFYTRIWKIEGSETSSEAVGLDTCQNWIDTRSITPEWNEDLSQYYVEYKDGTATYKIWVEDVQSLGAKLNIMQSYGLAGCAAWKLGLGNDSAWNVICSYMK